MENRWVLHGIPPNVPEDDIKCFIQEKGWKLKRFTWLLKALAVGDEVVLAGDTDIYTIVKAIYEADLYLVKSTKISEWAFFDQLSPAPTEAPTLSAVCEFHLENTARAALSRFHGTVLQDRTLRATPANFCDSGMVPTVT